jgi:hypothetical protein
MVLKTTHIRRGIASRIVAAALTGLGAIAFVRGCDRPQPTSQPAHAGVVLEVRAAGSAQEPPQVIVSGQAGDHDAGRSTEVGVEHVDGTPTPVLRIKRGPSTEATMRVRRGDQGTLVSADSTIELTIHVREPE